MKLLQLSIKEAIENPFAQKQVPIRDRLACVCSVLVILALEFGEHFARGRHFDEMMRHIIQAWFSVPCEGHVTGMIEPEPDSIFLANLTTLTIQPAIRTHHVPPYRFAQRYTPLCTLPTST